MNILFVREKEGNTINDVLCRIQSYLEIYVRENHIMPDVVKLSNNDVKRIREHNKTLINEDNQILGMKIVIYDKEIHRNRFNREYKKGI